MTRIILLVVALALCVGAYFYFYAGDKGILGGAESYEEAQDEFADIRPADTVWTPEMNAKQSSAKDQ